MSRTAQEAAAARAAAAKNETASSRLSALEVERQGYVQRGDEDGVAAVDEEIARYSRELRVPLAASRTSSADDHEEPGPDLEEVKELIRPLVIEILHEVGILGDGPSAPAPDTAAGEVVPDPTSAPADPDPTQPTGDVVPDPTPAPEQKRRPRRSAAVAADEPAES